MDIAEKVLRAHRDDGDGTIVVDRLPKGKMRVTSSSWKDASVILKDQVLEVRNFEGRLHIARKPRHHDEWDPHVPDYDPYGRGAKATDE